MTIQPVSGCVPEHRLCSFVLVSFAPILAKCQLSQRCEAPYVSLLVDLDPTDQKRAFGLAGLFRSNDQSTTDVSPCDHGKKPNTERQLPIWLLPATHTAVTDCFGRRPGGQLSWLVELCKCPFRARCGRALRGLYRSCQQAIDDGCSRVGATGDGKRASAD